MAAAGAGAAVLARAASIGRGAGAFALGNITASANEATDSINDLEGALTRLDDTAKSARGLGIMAEDLQALQHAAEMAGLRNLDATLQRVNQRLGAAMIEGGRYADMLERIGVTSRDLENLDTAQRFELIANALNNVEDAAARAYLAQQLGFGRTITGLADIVEAQKEALEFQERFNLATQDTAAIEARNDAFSKLSQLTEGLSNRMAERMAPAMERVAETILRILDDGNRFAIALEAIGSMAEFAAARLDNMINAMEQMINLVPSLPGWVWGGLMGGFISPGSGGDSEGSQPGFGFGGNDTALNVGAALSGSREAFSTIYSRQSGETAADQTARNTAETNEILREIAALERRVREG